MNNIQRNAHRGVIQFKGRRYFALALLDVTEPVLIKPISQEEIMVFDMSGAFICTAEIDENKRATFPVNL